MCFRGTDWRRDGGFVDRGLFKDKGASELDRIGVNVIGRKAEAQRVRSILSGISAGLLQTTDDSY